jgi:hypothetical protein
MRVGGEVSEPVEIEKSLPNVPERLKTWKARILVVEGIVQNDGSVTAIRVLRPDPIPTVSAPCIDAYVRATSKWRYRPATYRGKPVPAYLTVSFGHNPC